MKNAQSTPPPDSQAPEVEALLRRARPAAPAPDLAARVLAAGQAAWRATPARAPQPAWLTPLLQLAASALLLLGGRQLTAWMDAPSPADHRPTAASNLPAETGLPDATVLRPTLRSGLTRTAPPEKLAAAWRERAQLLHTWTLNEDEARPRPAAVDKTG